MIARTERGPVLTDPFRRDSGPWHRAVTLGAHGRYLASWWWLDRLDSPDADPAIASLSSSTRGSHLRQVGAIDRARRCDSRALEVAEESASAPQVSAETAAEALVEAHLGLAADAIVQTDAEQAHRHLAQAEAIIESNPAPARLHDGSRSHKGDWRIATRAAWVRAEWLLLCGDAQAAVASAHRAVRACRGRSDRHRVKSEAILAAALVSRGEAQQAAEITRRIAIEAGRRGWASLSWPIALIAIDAEAMAGQVDSSGHLPAVIATGAQATRTIEAHLPADIAGHWRARSDVGRLRALAGG